VTAGAAWGGRRGLSAASAAPGWGPVLGHHRFRPRDVDDLAAGDVDHLGVAEGRPAARARVGDVVDDLVGGVGHLQGVALGPGLLARPPFAAGGPCLLGLAILGLALASGSRVMGTKNFFGMARYVMAAFPCFAVVGDLLAERPRVAAASYTIGGAGLFALTLAFGRGYYLS